jgi:hypothetical protein
MCWCTHWYVCLERSGLSLLSVCADTWRCPRACRYAGFTNHFNIGAFMEKQVGGWQLLK